MLRPLELTVAQFDALANLYPSDGMSQQALAEKLLVTKGNVTGLVNRLAQRRLVVRKVQPADRRANRIFLTKSGRALAKRALLVQRKLIEDMMGALDAREQDALRKHLDRVVMRLDAARAGE
jgi:DNA-binding MarR family transcriptional regulator